MDKKTPITVFTGHLGSGKTTLIQKVLKMFPKKKVLVIENEFGEIGIDGEILSRNDNALVELNAGCVCCNIQSDLEMLLEKYISEGHDFDHIIIEATGVANPAKIVQQFVEPCYLSKFFQLKSALCVVDAVNYQKHKELEEFDLQILTSDSFYLSKTNASEELDIASLLKEVGVENKDVIQDKDLGEWFERDSFFALDESLFEEEDHPHDHDHHDHDHDHHHGHGHDHDHGHSQYQKLAFHIEGEFDPFTLENYLNILFMQYMGRIYRTKGLLYFLNAPHPVLVQGVFDSLSFKELEGYSVDKKVSKLVLIGKDLDEASIKSSLENCLS